MELIEARALKSSFLSGMAMKANQQLFFDDLWCVTEINSVHTDDFSVDDLLDFSDKDFKDGSFQELREDNEKNTFHGSSSHHRNSQVPTFSGMESLESLSAGEIPVPVEELENLEWLSQIVDDSTSEYSLLCPVGSFKTKTESFPVTRPEPVVRKQFKKTRVPCFPLPVPVKPRTKRCRPAGKSWSLTSPTTSADSSSPSSSSYGSSPLPSFVFPNGDLFCSVEKPAYKKPKKDRLSDIRSTSTGVTTQRRCTHCQVQKTPQWRTGPLGPKTLCNACGVRFKSGRLFPEYRPACSPTFSQESHSNSHRKVLEMRRKRDMGDVVDSGPAHSVQTC